MLQQIRNARRDESGFTLVELLIVITILGVLSAIVVFAVNGISDKGTTSACKADVKTVTVAAEAYYAKNGSYAATMPALVTAGFLHSAPSTTNYTVTYVVTAGTPPTVAIGSTSCP
jgi:prepilin-type N-terminal cleavage/methylation domain-containing protein